VSISALHNRQEESRSTQDPTHLGRVLGNDHARVSAIPIPRTLAGTPRWDIKRAMRLIMTGILTVKASQAKLGPSAAALWARLPLARLDSFRGRPGLPFTKPPPSPTLIRVEFQLGMSKARDTDWPTVRGSLTLAQGTPVTPQGRSMVRSDGSTLSPSDLC
jgi:hypothetical protein